MPIYTDNDSDTSSTDGIWISQAAVRATLHNPSVRPPVVGRKRGRDSSPTGRLAISKEREVSSAIQSDGRMLHSSSLTSLNFAVNATHSNTDVVSTPALAANDSDLAKQITLLRHENAKLKAERERNDIRCNDMHELIAQIAETARQHERTTSKANEKMASMEKLLSKAIHERHCFHRDYEHMYMLHHQAEREVEHLRRQIAYVFRPSAAYRCKVVIMGKQLTSALHSESDTALVDIAKLDNEETDERKTKRQRTTLPPHYCTIDDEVNNPRPDRHTDGGPLTLEILERMTRVSTIRHFNIIRESYKVMPNSSTTPTCSGDQEAFISMALVLSEAYRELHGGVSNALSLTKCQPPKSSASRSAPYGPYVDEIGREPTLGEAGCRMAALQLELLSFMLGSFTFVTHRLFFNSDAGLRMMSAVVALDDHLLTALNQAFCSIDSSKDMFDSPYSFQAYIERLKPLCRQLTETCCGIPRVQWFYGTNRWLHEQMEAARSRLANSDHNPFLGHTNAQNAEPEEIDDSWEYL